HSRNLAERERASDSRDGSCDLYHTSRASPLESGSPRLQVVFVAAGDWYLQGTAAEIPGRHKVDASRFTAPLQLQTDILLPPALRFAWWRSPPLSRRRHRVIIDAGFWYRAACSELQRLRIFPIANA